MQVKEKDDEEEEEEEKYWYWQIRGGPPNLSVILYVVQEN